MTLVDSNIIIDVLRANPAWLAWSIEQLHARGQVGPLFVNEVVYAEVAGRLPSEAALEQALAELQLTLARIPVSALFLVGQSFRQYRASGGPRTSLLPDFFIGAHAQTAGVPILTRDARRYRTYFPNVQVITPER